MNMLFRNPASFIAVAMLVFTATSALAESDSEIDSWSVEFKDAAATGNAESIFESLDKVRDDRLDQDKLRKAVASFVSNFKMGNPRVTKKIDDQRVDDLYRRFTIAVLLDTQHLYYTTTFINDSNGWKLVNLQMNTDLNKVLNQPWPQ